MDFESRVWDCDGRDSVAVRCLPPGNRRGNSKKGEGGLKVLIFHYVAQSAWRLGVRKGFAVGLIFAALNIPWGFMLSPPEDLPFSIQKFPQDRTLGC
jgi:hypothetical protein